VDCHRKLSIGRRRHERWARRDRLGPPEV
jgi:hypothetical protein